MAILRKIIFFAVLPLLLSSCYTDFEPDIKSTPVLCMNCLLSEGDTIRLDLTRTWRWSEGSPFDSLNVNVPDADVRLYVNDEFVSEMRYKVFGTEYDFAKPNYGQEIKGYTCDYIPRIGDKIRFEAHSDKYGEASAEVVIPDEVKIDRVESTVFNMTDLSNFYNEGGEIYRFDLNMLVWFTDPADQVNRYQFGTSWTSSDTYYEGHLPRGWEYIRYDNKDLSREPLFTEHVSPLESVISDTSGYTFFTDRQISGISYPLHISIAGLEYNFQAPDHDPDYLTGALNLELSSISQSYYDHVLSVWVANDGIAGSLGSVGLGDAVFEASNVSTGAGVVAAETKYTYKINLKKLVEENK